MAGSAPRATISGMKRTAVAAAVLLSLTACGIELEATPQHSNQTFPFTGGALTIKVPLGGLRVTQGTGPQVVVDRWLRGKAAKDGNSAWTLRDGTLALTARCTLNFGDCGARYTVAVPSGVPVLVEGGDDGVIVSGLAQNVTLVTTGGSIKVDGLSGVLRLRSDDGSITAVRTRSADVRARTNSGAIRLGFDAAPPKVDAASDDGRVVATVPAGEYSVKVESKDGRARSTVKDAGPGATKKIIARSFTGNVTVSAN